MKIIIYWTLTLFSCSILAQKTPCDAYTEDAKKYLQERKYQEIVDMFHGATPNLKKNCPTFKEIYEKAIEKPKPPHTKQKPQQEKQEKQKEQREQEGTIMPELPPPDPFPYDIKVVKAQQLQMGSNDSMDNNPIHSLFVNGFKIGETEVTQQLWRNIMGTLPQGQTCDNCPVTHISWDEVKSFLSKLNDKTGRNYRLCTEAEWELAAKAGQSFEYSGSNDLQSVAWYADNAKKVQPVKTKKPNTLGLYDMSGNVWEWCADDAGDDNGKILKGGGLSQPQDCRITTRHFAAQNHFSQYIGFRLCQSY